MAIIAMTMLIAATTTLPFFLQTPTLPLYVCLAGFRVMVIVVVAAAVVVVVVASIVAVVVVDGIAVAIYFLAELFIPVSKQLNWVQHREL